MTWTVFALPLQIESMTFYKVAFPQHCSHAIVLVEDTMACSVNSIQLWVVEVISLVNDHAFMVR
jgi:hypothetical protein